MNTEFENASICSKCKGGCCKRSPGIVHPDDIIKKYGDITPDVIVDKYLKEGYYLDYWEGVFTKEDGSEVYSKETSTLYFLLPRSEYVSKTQAVYPSWGGRCNFLTENGCSLEFKERPFQCRVLIPQEDFNCNYTTEQKASKRHLVEAWLEYQEVLIKSIDLYNNS